MNAPSTPANERPPVRPIPDSYWVVPGRLLSGEHPGSLSRATAMERLRRFLAAGVTCFVDLTQPEEMPAYEALLPFSTPDGRRVEYLREPIEDHAVPSDPAVMAKILATIDSALAAGHVVYVHCRAGVGRSATVIGCWLAMRSRDPEAAIEELQAVWRQSARSRIWPAVPETDEQLEFIRSWQVEPRAAAPAPEPAQIEEPVPVAVISARDRLAGAILGLAVGDAFGAAFDARAGGEGRTTGWTQHTALALCTAESLVASRGLDARDMMQRFLRWQSDGHMAAAEGAPVVSEDIARALANYRWRGQPMAGSHDPRDRSTSSLSRAVVAAVYEPDIPAAVALAGECSRTTHQSPVIVDTCRHACAMLIGALRGDTAALVGTLPYEAQPGLWMKRPLRPEVAALTESNPADPEQAGKAAPADVIQTLSQVRSAVTAANDFERTLHAAVETARDRALAGAMAGAFAGAVYGARAIPARLIDALPRGEVLDRQVTRLLEARQRPAATPDEPRQS
jgi:ADP-ribosylglycohydrolase/protein-tyrosine phosphatase